jgi:hypothetical protein
MRWKIWSATPPPMLDTIVSAECDHRGIETDSPQGRALRVALAKILVNRTMSKSDLASVALQAGWFRVPAAPCAATVH